MEVKYYRKPSYNLLVQAGMFAIIQYHVSVCAEIVEGYHTLTSVPTLSAIRCGWDIVEYTATPLMTRHHIMRGVFDSGEDSA